MDKVVFKKEWKYTLLAALLAFVVLGAIALLAGFFGFAGAAGVIASIGGLIGAAGLFDGVKNLLSPSRLIVTDEKIIFKAGTNAEYILTKDNSSGRSWEAAGSVLAVEFDDGTAISFKDFDCPAIYRCLEEYDWPYLPDSPMQQTKMQEG